MKSCGECFYFRRDKEDNYSLFCCKLKYKSNDAYSEVLSDINWSNYQIEVSKDCPLKHQTNNKRK